MISVFFELLPSEELNIQAHSKYLLNVEVQNVTTSYDFYLIRLGSTTYAKHMGMQPAKHRISHFCHLVKIFKFP